MTDQIDQPTPYDSRIDTHKHRDMVRVNLAAVITDLFNRASTHDLSKLKEPERSMYDKYVPKLEETEYGTPAYRDLLAEMNVGLAHHYEANRHHPEHFEHGVNDMTLIDLIEMLCDWEAAAARKGQNPLEYLAYNVARFGIDPQLAQILRNTIKELWPSGLPTLYVIVEGESLNAGGRRGDVYGYLLTDKGEQLCSHVSSTVSFLKNDLTTSGDRRWNLKRRYPDGYELEVVDLAAGDKPPPEIAEYFDTRAAT